MILDSPLAHAHQMVMCVCVLGGSPLNDVAVVVLKGHGVEDAIVTG